MSIFQVQCTNGLPVLRSDRKYSDGSVPVCHDVSISLYNKTGATVQPLIVSVGGGNGPYTQSAVVSKRCSVNLYDVVFTGSNGSTAQLITFVLFAGKEYTDVAQIIVSKTMYLGANEAFEIKFDRVENVTLDASDYKQVYFRLGVASAINGNFYCNVVADD